ncbi:MAG: hypothetical protein J6W00_10030, partial [Lentisphaeria bacterium]|nr:hypothetical protein [Lentisphaeria bacterium]
MMIPYQYNKMGVNLSVEVNPAIYGTCGVFTLLPNRFYNQKAMTLTSKYLDSKSIPMMEVYNSGIARNTTIGPGGTLHINSGGDAEYITCNSYGGAHIYSGGKASNAVINLSGSVIVNPYGTLSNVNVNSYGRLFVSENATVSNLSYFAGAGISCQGSNIILDDITLHNNAQLYNIATSGIRMSNVSILANAMLYCSSGVTIHNVSIKTSGALSVNSGGKCFNITMENGAKLIQGVWGKDDKTCVTGSAPSGSFWTSEGTACNYHLFTGATQVLYYYAKASSTTVSSGGIQYVSFGAVANQTVVS